MNDKFNIGDFILGKDKRIYRIVDSYSENDNTLYDIKSINYKKVEYFKCINSYNLKKFGIVISKYDGLKLAKLFYN